MGESIFEAAFFQVCVTDRGGGKTRTLHAGLILRDQLGAIINRSSHGFLHPSPPPA